MSKMLFMRLLLGEPKHRIACSSDSPVSTVRFAARRFRWPTHIEVNRSQCERAPHEMSRQRAVLPTASTNIHESTTTRYVDRTGRSRVESWAVHRGLMPGSVEARKGRTRTPRGPMRQLKWFASSWARFGAGLSSAHRPSANVESDARARPVPQPVKPSPSAALPRTSAHRLGAARRASSNLVPRVRRTWTPHLAACPQTQLPPDALRSKPLKVRTPCFAPPKTC